jgi:phospholipid/cholesterol/gamma-HCH transport system substrate-binding protein
MRLATFVALASLLAACGHRDERVVHALLPAARSLREGVPVRYRGIEVGRLTTMRIVDSGVRLDLDIQRADAPLRTADQVRIAPVGIFGDAEVEIVPGPVSAPKLASNGWLAASPPDTLAAIRDAVIAAMVKNSFDRLGVFRDSASLSQKRADSVHPPPTRPHP